MYPRKPLPHGEQIARLKTYLRRARTDLRRKYDEFFEATKGRRDCPLEVQIKHRAIEARRHAQEGQRCPDLTNRVVDDPPLRSAA